MTVSGSAPITIIHPEFAQLDTSVDSYKPAMESILRHEEDETNQELEQIKISNRITKERINQVKNQYLSFKNTCIGYKIDSPEAVVETFKEIELFFQQITAENFAKSKKIKSKSEKVAGRRPKEIAVMSEKPVPGTVLFKIEELKKRILDFDAEVNKERKEYQATINNKTWNESVQKHFRARIDLLKEKYWKLLAEYQGDVVEKTAGKTEQNIKDEQVIADLVARGILPDTKALITRTRFSYGILGKLENKISNLESRLEKTSYKAPSDSEGKQIAANLSSTLSIETTKQILEEGKSIKKYREEMIKALKDSQQNAFAALNTLRESLQLFIHSHEGKCVPIKSLKGFGSWVKEAAELERPLEKRPPIDKAQPSPTHVKIKVPQL